VVGIQEKWMAIEWLLVRTKAGEERIANECLTRFADQTFLPLMKVRVRRWGKVVESIVPLFACYLFAVFDLEREYNHVRHTPGVQYVVHYGGEAAVVPGWIIRELKARCAGGPIEIPKRELLEGDTVRVIGGPFQEFEGIFERKVSGAERVAILLSAMGAGARVVMPASMVEKAT
jgi:transcription antitermination factor NusG